MEITQEITKEKLLKYFDTTQKALDKVEIVLSKKTHLHEAAKDFYDMAQRYVSDATHFREKQDYVTAFAALNYAHGWLDAGARIGLFEVQRDSNLFTVE